MISSIDVSGSRSMAMERVRIASRSTSFASQLAFDIHVLTTDVSAHGDGNGALGATE